MPGTITVSARLNNESRHQLDWPPTPPAPCYLASSSCERYDHPMVRWRQSAAAVGAVTAAFTRRLRLIEQPEGTAAAPAILAPDSALPTGRRERVVSIDVLRGVAVLGILLVNVVPMGLPFAAHDDPTIAGNRSPADFWSWAIVAVLVDGKMRAIFSILFGAGVVLAAKRALAAGAGVAAADVHLRRNLWLVVFGAVHSYLLLWPGDVLFTYGVAGLPLFLFRRVRPRTLIVCGILILALQAPAPSLHNAALAEASAGLREIERVNAGARALTPEQRAAWNRWTQVLAQERPTAEMLQEGIDNRRGGYLRNLAAAANASLYLESVYLYQVGLWDALALMLIGMALLELGVLSGEKSSRFYLRMALAGYAIGLPIAVWVIVDWTEHGFEPGLRWTSLTHLTRVCIALGHVGVVMMACKTGAYRRVTALLAAAGRMALTNYILQTVICMTIFSGFGLGWFARLARHQLYYVVAAIWVFQLLSSTLWLRQFRFGPLEWLWRSLSYQRRQPFRV
jgi:uncharacterized protein